MWKITTATVSISGTANLSTQAQINGVYTFACVSAGNDTAGVDGTVNALDIQIAVNVLLNVI